MAVKMTKETIEFSDWDKLDLRIAEIISVEDIAGADKLYKIEVDVGEEIGKRTICAGIKKHYSKDELIGKKIILFANLAPRKLKGIESKGMLLASSSEDKSEVILISPEKDIENGSLVG